MRVFGLSIVVTVAALVVAGIYDGWDGVALAGILGILEISLSFDNAVINAGVLERMSDGWQRAFLTIGMLIAVFGMRLVFPLAVVWIAAGIAPPAAFDLALHPPADGAEYFPNGDPSYATLLHDAHPQIAAFGGMFLLMLFVTFLVANRAVHWLGPVERPLSALGRRIPGVAFAVGAAALLGIAQFIAPTDERATVLFAGLLGIVVYLTVNGLGEAFHTEPEAAHDTGPDTGAQDGSSTHGGSSNNQGGKRGTASALRATGKAAFFMFLYLEVLDASFSFDGVIGAFAITPDPIIILLGLGCIGAMFVRSVTVYLVHNGTLAHYRYLEHGAHWAIGALATILLVSIAHEVSDIVTGTIGVALIIAAAWSSSVANRRDAVPQPI